MAPKNLNKLLERQKKIGDSAVQIQFAIADEKFRGTNLEGYTQSANDLKAEFIKNNKDLVGVAAAAEDYFVNKYYEYIMTVFEEIEHMITTIKEKSSFKTVLVKDDDKQQEHLIQQTEASKIKETEFSMLPNDQEQLEEEFFSDMPELEREIVQLSMKLVTMNNDQIVLNKRRLENMFEDLRALYLQLNKNRLKWKKAKSDMRSIEVQMNQMLTTILGIKKEPSIEAPHRWMPKLADIQIPSFDGEDITEWSQFHDLFKSLVHNSTQLSDVDKLYYLKGALKGEAAKTIQQFKTTDANYAPAFEVLKNRYENRRLLFETQVDKILDQPQINSDSATSVKQLLDTTNICIQAIKAMDIDITDAQPFISRIIVRKLDRNGLRFYEQNIKKNKEIQTLEDVMEFLEQQYRALESMSKQGGITNTNNKFHKKGYSDHRATHAFVSTKQACLYCNRSNHVTAACHKFFELSATERQKLAKNKKWCFKCINHTFDQYCKSNHKCSICRRSHHEALHINEYVKKDESKPSSSTSMVTKEESATYFLPTALVKVRAKTGELVTLRALIDHASQISSISEEASQILGLPRIKASKNINGLGCTEVGTPNSKIKLKIQPRFESDQLIEAEAWVMPSVTDPQPEVSFKIDASQWESYDLADPMFNKTDRIDLLLGGKVFLKIMRKVKPHIKGDSLAQSTKLGWIVCGLSNNNQKPSKFLSAVTNLERFWELEELPSNIEEATEDKICLDQYEKTTKIDADGKLVVKLPLKEDCELGDSRRQAMARFLNLEKKLESNNKLREDYVRFMGEYLQLGHMTEVKGNITGKYYLPHQPVIRESSLTTKLRVVFDASAKTSNGKSLNEVMFIGPKLQRDLFNIILNWRVWKYALTADVEKMYRQIKLAEDDQSYQYILWRDNKKDPIKEYRLTTVTYGTASAPFLAIKSLFHIADSCTEEKDYIKNIIKNDFYMDDLMTGADTIPQCKKIQHEVESTLLRFGFNLRKWLSNEEAVTSHLKNSNENKLITIKDDESVKTLGLQWDPKCDSFSFNISLKSNTHITKRQALSDVARIFDPLGWLSPVTVVAKLFIQKLWLLQSAWDEVLSEELNEEWLEFTNFLPELQQIKVPRWIQITSDSIIELHGFADASEKAYAAVIYAKTEHSVVLITAKTKVNPIKNKKTLPKLELCAAHLLAKLLNKVASIIERHHTIYTWSDSTITLSWINNKTNKDKFVRNRVTEIRSLLPNAIWNHVSSKDNPADVASRGICARKFKHHSLWWDGPEWLSKPVQFWPKKEENIAIIHATTMITSSTQVNFLDELIRKHSNFKKLQRVLAYILRFINKIKNRSEANQHITVSELEAAERCIIIRHQEKEFHHELAELKRSGHVNKNSKIANLCPFIDKDSILRVGGRLENSNLPYNKKHPMILRKSHLASTIIEETHISTLHGGNKLVEATLRRRYWILNMKNSVKKCIRSCPKCIRYRQEASKQLMGNLPMSRVTESYPFSHTGVDYAGPIHIRCSKGRGVKTYKGYIAVFVCMATKAVHLEAVSDLTTEAFMAALKRFFARRGTSAHIYSDNGTNFVGADRKLDADYKAAVKNNQSVIPILAAQKIQWHFIPPAAPHFGGIWEAGVKSMKYHLKRIVGETKLTYEEMSTLLAQIESVLNSRPLVDISNENIDVVDVLTPGHFLIGRPVTDCPEHIEDSRISSLNRWKLIQKLRKDFWNRWKSEYLVTLQQRSKWRQPVPDLKKGTIVLVKDETTVPAKWPLGRIIETHKGKDDKVRVVTIKLQNSTLKRPIHKVCTLPLPDESEDEEEPPATSVCTVAKQSKKRTLGFWFLLLMMMTSQIKAAPSKSLINACPKNLQGQFNCVGNIAWKQSRHAECNFEEVAKKSVWKALSTENTWIFTVFDQFTLSVDCGLGNRSRLTLPPKGILSLPPGCTAIYEGVTLTAPLRFSTETTSSIQTSSWGLDIDRMESKLVKPFHLTIVNNSKHIGQLMAKINNLEATNIELKTMQYHHLSGHTSLTLVFIIILICGCI